MEYLFGIAGLECVVKDQLNSSALKALQNLLQNSTEVNSSFAGLLIMTENFTLPKEPIMKQR